TPPPTLPLLDALPISQSLGAHPSSHTETLSPDSPVSTTGHRVAAVAYKPGPQRPRADREGSFVSALAMQVHPSDQELIPARVPRSEEHTSELQSRFDI